MLVTIDTDLTEADVDAALVAGGVLPSLKEREKLRVLLETAALDAISAAFKKWRKGLLTRQAAAKPHDIIVQAHGGSGWMARIADELNCWEVGTTQVLAVRTLRRRYCDYFGFPDQPFGGRIFLRPYAKGPEDDTLLDTPELYAAFKVYDE